MDISKDKALSGLTTLLGLAEPPKRIEGFDISHMSGTDTVASMVVFSNGIPEKAAYRKFKMRTKVNQNDDFAHMHEAISRRLSDKNVKQWGLPSLFLIDGGKGQLRAALKAREAQGRVVPMIGLAKREEEIVTHKEKSNVHITLEIAKTLQTDVVVQETGEFYVIRMSQSADIVKLLQRIRDESHRFAVSYHSSLKGMRQTASWLDEVPGIGPLTKKKLIRTFGSARGVTQARSSELQAILGENKTAILKQYIRAHRKITE